jgi:hypothetical protein
MFGIDWNNSQTLWLNLTNAALGIVTIICAGVIAKGILVQFGFFAARVKEDYHVLNVPGLGITMADGGDPVDEKTQPGKH